MFSLQFCLPTTTRTHLVMFSLQFCLPTTTRTHFFSPQPRPPSPNSLYILRTSSHLPHPLCAVAQNVIVEEDDVVSERVAVADAGAPPAVGETLPAGLRGEAMPKHVAVIMDGNRRWARMKGLSVGSGYKAGIRSLRVLVELCCRWRIRVLSVFAFSSDNWLRPKVEVDFLMSLFEQGIKDELDNFVREGVQISIIGDSSKLPESLQQLITNAGERTKHNSRLQLIVAVSYSGQYDIVQACQSIALKVKDGLIEPEDVDEFLIEQELETKCTKFPYPDLLIRTSGELRVSNFLLWQLAYTELFFSQSHWPDFGEAELLEALQSFQQRQRRYGRQVL